MSTKLRSTATTTSSRAAAPDTGRARLLRLRNDVERQPALESVRRTLHLAWHLALRHLLEQQIRYNGVCLEAACGLRTSQVRGAFIKYTP